MPTLSKDAEIDLLKDAFMRFSDPSGWQPFLRKIDAYLTCSSYAAEFCKNGLSTGHFSDQEKVSELFEFLQATKTDHGMPAFDYMLHHAHPGHCYQLSDGYLTDLGHDPPLVKVSPSPPPLSSATHPPAGVISVLRPNSHAAVFFGLFVPDQNRRAALTPEIITSFRKVIQIAELRLNALENLRLASDTADAHKAMAEICGSPSVLINGQRDILAEFPPGLDALGSLEAASAKNGILQLKNRTLETRFQELLASAKLERDLGISAEKPNRTKSEPAVQDQRDLYLRDSAGSLTRITLERLDHRNAGNQPWILVRVLLPAAVPETVETILLEEFGLSLSEAHLARLLAVTGSVPNTTDLLNITRNTMKTHLRRIFDKTGTRTQLELTQLVYQLTGLV
ncbi:helix-turn-helix transcriptional regulator [Roseibium sp.]|uniref:helix-turn-helix transcriptional regulator n=1 Tax=Roseibium sp. TaxID=1936156 RepID=UPI003B51D0C2